MRLSWSEEAKRDLWEIRDYSIRRWGTTVAKAYVGEVVACAKGIAVDPSRLRPYRGPFGYAQSGKHYVFAIADDAQSRVTIVRVLHQSMDLARHLPDT